MIVLGESVRGSTEMFVLFAEPVTAATVAKLGLPASGRKRNAFHHAELSAAAFRRAVEAARTTRGIACIASTAGAQRTVSGAARTELLGPVLDALVAHFERMTDDEDFSPWLLTRIIATTIRMKITADELALFARAIDASLGRGDDTSTEQNLTAFGNLMFYARRTNRAAADRTLAKFPALVGLHVLSDRRLWPRDQPLAPAVRDALRATTARHARAIEQLARAALDHHEVTDEIRACMTPLLEP